MSNYGGPALSVRIMAELRNVTAKVLEHAASKDQKSQDALPTYYDALRFVVNEAEQNAPNHPAVVAAKDALRRCQAARDQSRKARDARLGWVSKTLS